MAMSVLPVPAMAQIKQEDLAQTGPRNEAVQEAAAWERVKQDLIYLRPEAQFNPDGSLEIEIPEKPAPESESSGSNVDRWSFVFVFGAIVIGIIALFIWKGSRIQVDFRQRSDRARPPGSDTGPDDQPVFAGDGMSFLDHLAGMADRREALILLVSRALERAAQANAMTLGRAQTARDVVRALPRTWQHRDTLGALVRQVEIVHFGGRDISEDRWQECLTSARPLFGVAA